jgi:hypothetical protein
MVTREPRVAIVGGLGTASARDVAGRARYFGSARDVGRGELVRLEQALRAGGIDRVVIRTRWNSHAVTARIRRVCRTLGVPVELVR